MLHHLGEGWFLIALATIAIVSFILGLVVDAIMGDDGFGAVGNGVVIAAGYFIGQFAADRSGFAMNDLTLAVGAGLLGALGVLATLSLLKSGLNRLVG